MIRAHHSERLEHERSFRDGFCLATRWVVGIRCPLQIRLTAKSFASDACSSAVPQKQKVYVTGVTIRDVKIFGKPHKSIALSLKGELPFGVAGDRFELI